MEEEENMLELQSVQPAPLEEAAGLARRSNVRYDAAGARARLACDGAKGGGWYAACVQMISSF